MQHHPAHIEGLGIISALGAGQRHNATRLKAREDGLAPLSLFPAPQLDTYPVCQVPLSILPYDPKRNEELATIALKEALADAGLEAHSPELARSTLLVGTISGMRLEFEQTFRAAVDLPPERYPRLVGPGSGRVGLRLAKQFGIHGPVLTYSTACTSSATALVYALWMLRHQLSERIIVVGTDTLNATLLHGFASLMLLDRDGSRPFDLTRAGIQIGEGAGAIILSRATSETPHSPGAYLIGGATLCEPYHMTGSAPDGSGGFSAMQQACADARIDPSTISAIKAHGTGSKNNDLAEGAALQRMFPTTMPPLSSFKRALGHTMGACGTLELAISIACLQQGFFPACDGFTTPDPEVQITPIQEHFPLRDAIVMCNTFGFGGSCVSLLLQHIA